MPGGCQQEGRTIGESDKLAFQAAYIHLGIGCIILKRRGLAPRVPGELDLFRALASCWVE